MIVLVIYENCVLAFKGERHPPIPAYANGPMALQCPLKRMQPVTGSIHVCWRARDIQRREQISEPLRMGWLNSGFRSIFGESL